LVPPVAGRAYPGSYGELLAWFPDDEVCRDYLDWLRWRDGWRCPACGGGRGWLLASGRRECAQCGRQTSVTAGTIFDHARTPLTVWFTACWMFATQKDGVSAQSLQRALEIGSYQTAWAMLHRLRSVLVNRIRMQGMIVFDWKDRYDEALQGLQALYSDGKLKYRESIVEGIDNAPRGLIGLLNGENFGKQLVRLV
jgi:hypothetical protein